MVIQMFLWCMSVKSVTELADLDNETLQATIPKPGTRYGPKALRRSDDVDHFNNLDSYPQQFEKNKLSWTQDYARYGRAGSL